MVIKNGTAKKICILILSIAMIFVLAVPSLAGIEWPETIVSFERYNPVYDAAVDVGTEEGNLALPETIRAIVEIPEGMDTSTFVQAEPKAKTSEDGSESFDYYSYGYVAPKNVADIYAAGEKAIYTILYADRDGSGKVGEVAYRLYGSIEGSENLWFACDEAGTITGAVIDVPVTWSGDYDGNTAGEYTYTAAVSAESSYKWFGEAPTAKVIVQKTSEEGEEGHDEEAAEEPEKEDQDGEDASQGEAAKTETAEEESKTPETETKPACDCGASYNQYGVIVHEKSCPQYVGECHCGENGEDVSAYNRPWQHREDCPYYSPIECMCHKKTTETVENFDCEGNSMGTTTEVVETPEFSHVHDPKNTDCPLYGKNTVEIKKLATDEKSVMAKEDVDAIIAAQEKGEILYKSLGKVEIVGNVTQNSKEYDYDTEMIVLSINGGGANDVAMDNAMTAATPTSGNPTQTGQYAASTPGTWKDYLNTIWMNTAFNKFAWTPKASTNAYNGWAWSGQVANQTTGTVTTNPLRIPTVSGTTCTVYSGEQLRYALSSIAVDGLTIKLGGNIDLDGNLRNWEMISKWDLTGYNSFSLDGQGHRIYNLGMFDSSNNTNGVGLFTRSAAFNVRNIDFSTAKIVAPKSTQVGIVGRGMQVDQAGVNAGRDFKRNFEDIDIFFSLFYGLDMVSPIGTISVAGNIGSGGFFKDKQKFNIKTSLVKGCFVYGRDHIVGFSNGLAGATVNNCMAIEGTVISTGGHSAGFISCWAFLAEVKECFASNTIYGTSLIGGFTGLSGGSTYTDCFSTGKLEGYESLGGFFSSVQGGTDDKFTRCYSTTLVGLRTEGSGLGGFVGVDPRKSNPGETFADCYAAGEVGNFTTDMSNPLSIGGMSSKFYSAQSFTNCYYDKQTTAMREWMAGNVKINNDETKYGVRGVLTSTTAKSGTGLASGDTGGSSDKGFRGFSDNSKWECTAQHYPQLIVFTKATATQWANIDKANMAKAYSKVSTATVFLDTWDQGYDWNNEVRTTNEISYNRTSADYKGGVLTYDTVRDIISPFTATYVAANTTAWNEMAAGGLWAGASTSAAAASATKNTVKINVQDQTAKGTVNSPGLNWYNVFESVSGKTGLRPLRLIGYMDIEAGQDKTIKTGELYNHRLDVQLTMMDTIVDNRIIGLDIGKNVLWSTFKQGGYPTQADGNAALSNKYFGAPTDHTNNMLTQFPASVGARLNTEIWRAAQNPDGSYVAGTEANGLKSEYGVKVTGAGTGNNATLDEKKWNGDSPIYTTVPEERKYIISYYWQLKDGRYVTDSKVITIVPDEYTLTTNVYNNGDNSANSTALKINNAKDQGANTNYVIPAATSQTTSLTKVPQGDDTAAAWSKANPDTIIKKIVLTFTDKQNKVVGTKTLTGNNLVEGADIVIPVKYEYSEPVIQAGVTPITVREVTKQDTVNVTYTVQKDAAGNYYLRFNKFNDPNGLGAAYTGTSDGIPVGTNAYINDMQFNTRVDLYVEQAAYIKVKKVVSNYEADQAGQQFVISLTNGVNTQFTLENNQVSKRLTTGIAAASKTFDVSEIVPMEYDLTDIKIENTAQGTTAPKLDLTKNADGVITGGTVTIYPGNELLITVTNKFTHEGYFKSRTDVENVFNH